MDSMQITRRPHFPLPRVKRSRSVMEREESNREENNNIGNRQLVICGDYIKNSIVGYAWNAYFDQNKIKKHVIVCCDISQVCEKIIKGIEDNSVVMKNISFLLIGTCNLYKKKVYFINQDFEFIKRRILALYKSKMDEMNGLYGGKDNRKKRGLHVSTTEGVTEGNEPNKKRQNRTSLSLKKRASIEDFVPAVISDFGVRKSRFSLNIDEISISGTQKSNYDDLFNEQEVPNSMLMDISGFGSMNFKDHEMEKVLEESFIEKKSLTMNHHMQNFNFGKGVSDSFNHLDNNMNMNNSYSILHDVIPKSMVRDMDSSCSVKSMSMLDPMNLNIDANMTMKSAHLDSSIMNPIRSGNADEFPNMTGMAGTDENELKQNRLNSISDWSHMNNDIMNNNMGMGMRKINPFASVSSQQCADMNIYGSAAEQYGNSFGAIGNANQRMTGGFIGINNMGNSNTAGAINISGVNLLSSSNVMGGMNSLNSMNNRDNLLSLNPFSNISSMNNNIFYRTNIPLIPGKNNMIDNEKHLGSMFGGNRLNEKKKYKSSAKSSVSSLLNFETYQNFDYFHQKDDDDGFMKKLNLLLGLDEKRDEETEKRDGKGREEVISSGVNTRNAEINSETRPVDRLLSLENKESEMNKTGNVDSNVSGETQDEKEKNMEMKNKELTLVKETDESNLKKKKLEKHIIDKNNTIKTSHMRSMMKLEKVDYKLFLIDTINNEINEKILNEYPAFQNFCLHTSDKIKPTYKLELQFGYESSDHKKKIEMFESYLGRIANNVIPLYSKKKKLESFGIKKCTTDNADGQHLILKGQEKSSQDFLSFEAGGGTLKVDDIHFEEIQERINESDSFSPNLINNDNANMYKNLLSGIPFMQTQNGQLDLSFNDLQFREEEGFSSKLNFDTQADKSLFMKDATQEIEEEKGYNEFLNDLNNEWDNDNNEKHSKGIGSLLENTNSMYNKLNSEFQNSSVEKEISIFSNYDFSIMLNKESDTSPSAIKSGDSNTDHVNINLKQEFDMITKEVLETYQSLSKKRKYISFDIVTKNKKKKSDISTLFYITLHLANLGYISIMQKPIDLNDVDDYEKNVSRPILIEFHGRRK